ncbi:MAG: NBR1-Ig-like domain-containing protein [Anaerolineae bacterium]|nr:NBR1-Ig-like domain-containing protein [Anaerolineae bacterium]
MRKLKPTTLILLAGILLVAAACGGTPDEESSVSDADLVLTEAADIANQSFALTNTAVAAIPTEPPEPTATPTLIVPTEATPEGGAPTLTPLPTGEVTATLPPTAFPTPTTGAVGDTPCLRASFEYETIPDGTRIKRTKAFTKLWRIKNTGTCTWTPAFSVIWVEGELMGASSSNQLTTVDVPPGGYVEIEILFVAPSQPGNYKSYWMLLSPDGRIFGVGITGTEWFWLDIEVYDPDG